LELQRIFDFNWQLWPTSPANINKFMHHAPNDPFDFVRLLPVMKLQLLGVKSTTQHFQTWVTGAV